jgi:ribonuclease P protein component
MPGFPKVNRGASLCWVAASASRRQRGGQGSAEHEAHLSTVESSPRTHAWVSLSYEDARRAWRHQCEARQGAQAPGNLNRVAGPVLGRIMRSADFELALSSPAKARSAHFAAHHVPIAPAQADAPPTVPDRVDLSTMNPDSCAQLVDDMRQGSQTRHWLGMVVPKRHARSAATRNLLRRQIRAAILRHESRLASGMWLVRLRAPFSRASYTSATSAALRCAARDELDGLLARAGH